MAKYDPEYGAPIGRTYMDRIASLLPNARVKDDVANRANWNVRFSDRVALPLRDLLIQGRGWLDAITEMVEAFRTVEQLQEEKNL